MDRDLQNERKEKNPDSLIKFPAMEKDSLRIRFRRRNFRPQINIYLRHINRLVALHPPSRVGLFIDTIIRHGNSPAIFHLK